MPARKPTHRSKRPGRNRRIIKQKQQGTVAAPPATPAPPPPPPQAEYGQQPQYMHQGPFATQIVNNNYSMPNPAGWFAGMFAGGFLPGGHGATVDGSCTEEGSVWWIYLNWVWIVMMLAVIFLKKMKKWMCTLGNNASTKHKG